MLQVNQLSKSYGDQLLLDKVSFVVNTNEKVGLIGRNGHGKSTLFRILTGEERADEGDWSIPARYQMGVLNQYFTLTEPTVLQQACLVLPDHGGWKEEYKAESILMGLGFSSEDFVKKPQDLSGGFQMRLNLATLLLSEPNMLLLDEPTNYLDIVSIRWLEGFLKAWEGEFILITHDRQFMDTVCNHTMGLVRKKIRKMPGGTKKWYAQIQEEDQIYEKTRLNEEARRAQTERFIERFKAQASKASVVQSRVKMLEKQGTLDKLDVDPDLYFKFRSLPFPGQKMLQIKQLSFGYTPSRILINKLELPIFPGDRLAVIGPNGQGKSTLLALLAKELQGLTGDIEYHDQTQIGYFGQTNVHRLNTDLSVHEEIALAHPSMGIGGARTLAGLMMFEGDASLKKIKVLSGGEKSRVLLAKILAKPVNLLLLDEPTHHLDMQSVDSLLKALEEFSGAVIMVTHDEELIHRCAKRLVVFDSGRCFVHEGNYADFLERIGWSFEKESRA